MLVVRKVPGGFKYFTRAHDWRDTGETQINPYSKRSEKIFECTYCGQRSVARLFATEAGPAKCTYGRWEPIDGLAPSLRAEILSGDFSSVRLVE